MGRNLEQLLLEEAREAGFEIYDWSLKPAGKRGRLLKVAIHSEAGVTLDDCARVSRVLGRALDHAELIEGRYTLEVSSPGMDRPLLRPRHYEIARGRLARLQLGDGSRVLEGTIGELEGGVLRLEREEGTERIPLKDIHKARLVPQFPGRERQAKGSTGGKK